MSTVNGENVIVIDIALDEDNNLQKIEESAVLENAGIGFIKPYAGTSIPEGYLYCDGSAISRAAYPELFAAIGTTWGEGDGASTFNVPDLRGVFVRCDGGENNAAIGVMQEDATSVKDFVLTMQRSRSTSLSDVNGGNNLTPLNINGDSSAYTYVYAYATGGTLQFPISGAIETRPVNVAMKYCIRYI